MNVFQCRCSSCLKSSAYTCLQLLCSAPASGLRLTKIDDNIYTEFRSQFPDLDVAKLDIEKIKSPEGKEVCVSS